MRSAARLSGNIVAMGVAVGVGLTGGSLALPYLGPWGAVICGVAIGAGAAFALRRIRRRPVPRRIYRFLLIAHVVFWTSVGVQESRVEPFVAMGEPETVSWAKATRFRAGVGTAAFRLPDHVTLAGWGMRPRRSAIPAYGGFGRIGRLSQDWMGPSVHGEPARVPMFRRPEGPGEPVGARALVLVPETGEPPVAIVRLDLIVVPPRLVAAVLAREASLVRATLVLSATHTHSCPGGFHDAPLASMIGTDHYDPAVFDAVATAVLESIHAALDAARPARMAVLSSRDRDPGGLPVLAKNRRDAERPVDDRVLALRLEDREDGHVLGVLLNYAVQPVSFRRHHTAFTRDLPGAIEDAVSGLFDGHPPVLFVNGATGDVTPRSTGGGTEGAARLASRFVACIESDLRGGEALETLRVGAARMAFDLGSPHALLVTGSRRAFAERVLPSPIGEDAPSVLANLIALPANAYVWSLGLTEVRVGFTFDGAVGGLVNLDSRIRRRGHPAGAIVLDLGDGDRAERAVLLWQGGIATQALGRRWRERARARGLPTPFLFGLSNDSASYLTTEAEYEDGGYEAASSLYGVEGGARVGQALFAALNAVLPPGDGE